MSQKYEYFGKYILLEKLATGGMAEVFLARAPGAGGIARFVAIKRILPQFTDNPEFINMFKDEAKIAVNLSHSNIVPIFEFGMHSHQFFLGMEYVEGRNLRQILNRLKEKSLQFSIEQVIYIIKEVASGLDHAHRCLDGATGKPLNITHRDMSPQNVMVSFEGELKIIDFGIAKAESQLEHTRAGTLKGKFGYMSPEQAEGQPLDLRTDIFSLGIVLWELLAHDRLFVANNELNTLRKIRDCQVPSLRKINPNIHPELERIVMRALTRDRNLRYQTAAALHRDLNRFLNRQYPDFSTQDFAAFIKNIYADDIIKTRKRLVEYAKIPFQPEANDHTIPISLDDENEDLKETLIGPYPDEYDDEDTLVTGPSANVPGDENTEVSLGDVSFGENSLTESSSPSRPSPTPASTSNSGVSYPSLTDTDSKGVLDDKALANELKTSANGSFHQTRSGIYAPSGSRGVRPGSFHTQTGIQRRSLESKRKSRSFSITPLLLFMALVFGSYLFLSNFFPAPLQKVNRVINQVFKPKGRLKRVVQKSPDLQVPPKEKHLPEKSMSPPPIQPSEPPPLAPVEPPIVRGEEPNIEDPTPPIRKELGPSHIVFNSDPSGAEIYINGSNTGQTTPHKLALPSEENYTITFKKPNYLDYVISSEKLAQITSSSFSATLQKARIAYIDIDVKPPRYSVVFINNQVLSESLPILKYAVPAGTTLTVRAESPASELYDEQEITLSVGERKRIILHLKKRLDGTSKRQPSSKRPK